MFRQHIIMPNKQPPPPFYPPFQPVVITFSLRGDSTPDHHQAIGRMEAKHESDKLNRREFLDPNRLGMHFLSSMQNDIDYVPPGYTTEETTEAKYKSLKQGYVDFARRALKNRAVLCLELRELVLRGVERGDLIDPDEALALAIQADKEASVAAKMIGEAAVYDPNLEQLKERLEDNSTEVELSEFFSDQDVSPPTTETKPIVCSIQQSDKAEPVTPERKRKAEPVVGLDSPELARHRKL